MKCQNCHNEFYAVRMLDSFCPACGGNGLGEVEYFEFADSGYAVSFPDFKNFLTDADPAYSGIRMMVAGWLDCEISNAQGNLFLRHTSGLLIPPLAAHLKIQLNKEWQFDLYQKAMEILR